jgi:hypothetical protein
MGDNSIAAKDRDTMSFFMRVFSYVLAYVPHRQGKG